MANSKAGSVEDGGCTASIFSKEQITPVTVVLRPMTPLGTVYSSMAEQ